MNAKFLHSALLITLAFLLISLLLFGATLNTRHIDNEYGALLPAQVQTATPPPRESWVTLPPMPESATQADYGAEIFRLVCRDCHGDVGQGLTYQWRSTWNPKDQDCWQSKCHSFNHPPDGFLLPHYIGPILGPGTLDELETAADLFEYTRLYMPWHNPNSMTDEENWQLTAFLVREQKLDPIEQPLDPNRAAKLLLHPDAPSTQVASTMPEASGGQQRPVWHWLVILTLSVAFFGFFFLLNIRRWRSGS